MILSSKRNVFPIGVLCLLLQACDRSSGPEQKPSSVSDLASNNEQKVDSIDVVKPEEKPAAPKSSSLTATLKTQQTIEINGNLPLSIDVPLGLTPEQARPWFDVFSWQSFLAMMWPSKMEPRGVPFEPNTASVLFDPPAGTSPVFSSYKEAYELFGQGDKTPTAWSVYDAPVEPCNNTDFGFGKKTLVMAAKTGTLLDEVNEAFSFPVIDQNLEYARSEVRFNQSQYDFILNGKLYLAKNLVAAQPVNMPESQAPSTQGALMVKATWRLMTDKDDLSRYYTTQGLLLESDGSCVPKTIGLVGMHIVQKLEQFPEWIWSSFEQVDNIERGHGSTSTTPISFNNGTATPATPRGWANRPPKVPPMLDPDNRTATQITRLNPIPVTPAGSSTVDINSSYQQLLTGSPLAYYQLIITQWPTNPEQFRVKGTGCTDAAGCAVYPQDSGQPFPVNGATNVVMETYFQSEADAAGAGGNSCMSCHYVAGKSDYSWVLQLRAH